MIPQDMTVVEMVGAGGPEVLAIARRPLPAPTANQVLIKVASAGVNGPDIVQRKGLYPPPKGASDLLGLEVSGEVVALGGQGLGWAAGDRVCALTNGGGYAEYVAVEAAHCLPVPDGISLRDAAGLPETFFTVWSNVFLGAGDLKGKRLLVHGGAGGIGSTAIQLGSAFGLSVFTTAGSPESCAFCLDLGAERAINYHDEDFVDIVRTAGGADIIVDIVGGDYIARNIKAARADARIIQLAFNRGSKVELELMPVMLKRLTYTGSTLRSRPDAFKAETAVDLRAKVWPLFAGSRLRAVTHAMLPLDRAGEAHAMLQAGGHRGKILLTPDDGGLS